MSKSRRKLVTLMLLLFIFGSSISFYCMGKAIVKELMNNKEETIEQDVAEIEEQYKVQGVKRTRVEPERQMQEQTQQESTQVYTQTEPEEQIIVQTQAQISQEDFSSQEVATIEQDDTFSADILADGEEQLEDTQMTQTECLSSEFSEEEINLLMQTTYAEAGICSEEAQRGVAATIIARAREGGKSIQDVVFAKGQFSCAISGAIYLVTANGNIPVTMEMAGNETTKSAVEQALEEGAGQEITSVIGGEPLFFYSPEALSEEARQERSNISNSIYVDRMVFYRVWG